MKKLKHAAHSIGIPSVQESTDADRFTIPADWTFKAEDVAEHWTAINDETGYSVPPDLIDWSRRFLSHLDLG